MDTTENEVHFNKSVLHTFNRKFWLKSESWQYAKKVFGWKADSWHIAKSITVSSLIAACILYKPVLSPAIDFPVMGIIWNETFNIFYLHVFRR